MKRIVLLCLIFMMALALFGCSSAEEEAKQPEPVFFEELPMKLSYEGKEISLVDVSAYEAIDNFSHDMVLISTFDISSLSEEEQHWLEKDMTVWEFLTNEDNGYDVKLLSSLGKVKNSKKGLIHYVSTTDFAKDNRSTFAGSDISISVKLKQGEEKTEVFYNCVLPDSLPETSTIEESLLEPINNLIHKKIDMMNGK